MTHSLLISDTVSTQGCKTLKFSKYSEILFWTKNHLSFRFLGRKFSRQCPIEFLVPAKYLDFLCLHFIGIIQTKSMKRLNVRYETGMTPKCSAQSWNGRDFSSLQSSWETELKPWWGFLKSYLSSEYIDSFQAQHNRCKPTILSSSVEPEKKKVLPQLKPWKDRGRFLNKLYLRPWPLSSSLLQQQCTLQTEQHIWPDNYF